MFYNHTPTDVALYFISYGATGMTALLCALYLLLRRGNGGEFEEVGTVVYRTASTGQERRLRLALTGQRITSEETLLRQFPICISDQLRLAADRFDLGVMRQGESKERGVVVLHRNDDNRKERIPVTIIIDKDTPRGLQHLKRQLTVAGEMITVTFDVIIK